MSNGQLKLGKKAAEVVELLKSGMLAEEVADELASQAALKGDGSEEVAIKALKSATAFVGGTQSRLRKFLTDQGIDWKANGSYPYLQRKSRAGYRKAGTVEVDADFLAV